MSKADFMNQIKAGLDGVDDAQQVFAVWVGSLMGMLRQCMQSLES